MPARMTPEFNTIAALAGDHPSRRVEAGAFLFQPGERGDRLFAVVNGEIQLTWGGDQAEVFGPGSCFGVGALVDPEHRRFGTAMALVDSEIIEMDRGQFLFALQELPMFALEMLHDLETRLRSLKRSTGEA